MASIRTTRRRRVRRRRTALVAGVFVLAAAVIADAEFAPDTPWMWVRPVVGEESAELIEPGQTLHDIAFDNRLGFDALERLNPEVDPWIPPPGTIVRLPTRYVLPPAESEGLVINIPEMRLYDFTRSGPPIVHAVAIGDAEDPTPVAEFTIGAKRANPVWYVPASIQREKPELPKTVPPGEDNPLGSRWMTLGKTSYGIHGTNVRWSIGRGGTHGCLRLYEDVMEALYDRIDSGTRVVILYEPFKWGTNGKDLFLESHPDYYGRHPDRLASALALPQRLEIVQHLDLERVRAVAEAAQGVPIRVGELP